MPTNGCIHIFPHICICVCLPLYIYIPTCVCDIMCVYIYIYIHIYVSGTQNALLKVHGAPSSQTTCHDPPKAL